MLGPELIEGREATTGDVIGWLVGFCSLVPPVMVRGFCVSWLVFLFVRLLVVEG